MDFTQRLEADAALVETRLSHFLDTLAGPDRTSPRLAAAMRHAVLGGGKRFRPFLVLESSRMLGLPHVGAVDAAAALECVHCYSLAHDDLPSMDNDRLRRGRPTVWCAFDEWTAILAGDALLTLAFEIVAEPSTHHDAAVRAELTLQLARASGAAGMVGGQAFDLEAERIPSATTATADHIRRLQAMKTGALIRYATTAGAILARADSDTRDRLAHFGDLLGYAFQIADDLLDVEGSAEETGKAVAKDAAAGKATLVSLMGVAAARAKLAELEAEAVAVLAPFGESARMLQDAARFVVNRRS
ncbi:MAG: polyprenyl synthetase family protein [Hyphomicrobiaceae bacterium]|nr:polyprenyl synthetase family protein [Hyphomicrobiaceae bacterium]